MPGKCTCRLLTTLSLDDRGRVQQGSGLSADSTSVDGLEWFGEGAEEARGRVGSESFAARKMGVDGSVAADSTPASTAAVLISITGISPTAS